MRRTFLTCLLLLSATTVLHAQASEALVLSGGGARGLAHVGVVMHLQEFGYDPDLVVGNSMGAVVGALYAAGYQPDEIKRRVLAVRWEHMFDPTPLVLGPDRLLRYPSYNIDLDVARLRVSRGLFGQWRVNHALAALLFDANARSRGDFDRLPRRFRAIAADLRTGAEVVLDSGDLARAVRASMAYPGFFAPVHWGNRLLVDGGIVDNLPVSVARRLGAHHIIAVDVVRPGERIESFAPFDVIDRSIGLMQKNLQRDTMPVDVLLLPDIAAVFLGPSFPEDPRPVIAAGEAAVRTTLPRKRITTDDGVHALPPGPSFSALQFESPNRAYTRLGERVFRDVVGRPYDADAVVHALDRLVATGIFEGVWPRVGTGADSSTLIVRLDAPPALTLALGAQYENDRGGAAWASLDRNGHIAALPAVFSAAGAVGSLDNWAALSTRLYAFPSLAWSLGAHAEQHRVRFFADDPPSLRDVVRTGGWFALEFPHILHDRLLTATARVDWIDEEHGSSGIAFGPLFRFAALNPSTRVGVPLVLEAERRWGDVRYTRLAFSGSLVSGRRGPQAAALVDLRGVSDGAPIDVQPALGDEHAIPGLRWGELRNNVRAMAGLDAAIPLRSGFAILRSRTGAVASSADEIFSTGWVTGGQLGVGWPTPLGMIEVAYGVATHGKRRVDVSIGRRF